MLQEGTRRQRRRWWVIAAGVGVGLAGLGVGAVVAAWPRAQREPVIRFVQVVPDDVVVETRAAVADFVVVFGPRRECVGGATVELVPSVDGGDARYRADDAVIEIVIPTTPARFRESLVHELAHHVEQACDDFDVLRDAILELTGESEWATQPRWHDRPAEWWAEAVVELVLGERIRHANEVPVDPALIDRVDDWIRRADGAPG